MHERLDGPLRPRQAFLVPPGSTTPPPPGELCGSPCLIIHGWGPGSEQIAQQIADQCRELRVRSRIRAIDAYGDVELTRFPSLIVVLPSYSDNLKVRTVLEPFASLVSDYRLRRSDGVAGVLSGDTDPMDAGVIHLIGEQVLVHNPAMRSVLRRACHVHIIEQNGQFDLLQPYRQSTPPPVAPSDEPCDVVADALHTTWSYIKEWGITDPGTVAELLACIKRCRSRYEDPKRPQLYRPHPDVNRNRLDLILDGPDIQVGDKKTWAENGARVWRYVLEQLQAVEPALARPAKPNARGAQKDLRQLFDALRIIDTHLAQSDPDMPPTLP